ncbi:hypothetical protein [Streptomyces colonosanans]|uniref:hypothetical protein n=1 Tax=Streptomyces colonosanans TaxID=1428652 RepID=UPI0015A66FBF|nr:hypothetical protein [Streptomyces colonosanans]
MEQPRIHLGNDDARLALTRTGEDSWQVTADQYFCLTAEFTAAVSVAESVA